MLGLGLNKLGRAIRSVFDPANLFGLADTGSYYDLDATTQPDTADAYHSTAAIYPVIDDGRGVVNLFINSSGIGESSWLKVRTSVSQTNLANPLTGRSDGCKVMETADTGAHYIYAASGFYTYVSGQPYIIEAWVEAAERDEFEIILPGGGFGVNKEVTFNLTDETTSTADTGITYGLDNLGSGLYRAWVAGTATANASANTVPLQLHDENGAFSYTGDITKGIYVYGLSLRNAATTGEYQYTGPYLNGPAQPIGLLLAGNRDNRGVVNRVNYNATIKNNSEDWRTFVGLNVTSYDSNTAEVTDPDGGNRATKIVADGGGTLLARKQNQTLTAGVKNGSMWVYVPSSSGATNWKCWFDYQDVEGPGGDTQTTFDQWVRVDVDVTLAATRTWVDINLHLDAAAPASGKFAYFYFLQVSDGSGVKPPQENNAFLGGPGDHMGNATSANRMTYSLLPYGGVRQRLEYSKNYENAAWTKSASATVVDNNATGPFGETDASTLTATVADNGLHQTIPLGVGLTVCASQVFAAGTAPTVVFRDDTGAGRHVVVTISSMTITSTSGTLLNYGIEPYGTGFYRVFIAYTTDNASSRLFVRPTSSTGTVILWDQQIEVGVTSPTPVQHAVTKFNISESGLPQIPYEYGDGSSDFHTLGKQYFGLKQDGLGVVNLYKFNRYYKATEWATLRLNVALDDLYDSTTGEWADKLFVDTNNATSHYIYQLSQTPVTSGNTVTFQGEFTADELDWIALDFGNTNSVFSSDKVWFDVANGVVGTTDADITASIVDLGNGRYRVVASRVALATGIARINILLCEQDNSTNIATGDNTSGLHVWRTQLEEGSATDIQDNSYTLGGSLGTAGLFADPTQQWSVGGDFLTSTTGGTLLAKAGATAGNKTLQVYLGSPGKISVTCRGSDAQYLSSITFNDLAPHVWLLVWDGSTLLLYVDRNDPVTVTVGTAAEEAQDITWFARTSGTPGFWLKGYGLPLLMEARALTASEATQFMQYHCDRIGVSA